VIAQFVVFGLCFAIGCPVYHAVSHGGIPANDFRSCYKLWHYGTAQYGGLVLWLIVVVLWYQRRNRILATMSLWLPSFYLGVAVGRIGCYLGGCCFGLPTKSKLGVYYPDWGTPSRIARRMVSAGYPATWRDSADCSAIVPAVHPTPLYAAEAAVLIFLIALLAERRGVASHHRVFGTIVLYASANLIIEQFRYFSPETYRWGLPFNSWANVGLIAVMIFCHIKFRDDHKIGISRFDLARNSTAHIPNSTRVPEVDHV